MKILDVTQGSPEWQSARARHFCASEAPAMMGASTFMARTELVRRKATCDVPEVDANTQALFDRGHAAEALAREHLEAELADELYPTTATDDTGMLLASFDGITMDGETGFEHKLWNEELVALVRAGKLPPMYYWQLEQQILVAGLKRVIFVVSDGTPEKWAELLYEPVPGRAAQLLAGWKQFAEDVKHYQHVEVLPAPAGRAIMALPSLSVQLVGEVKESNLVVYRQNALAFIQAINTDLQTDQHFADAEKTVKFCADAEAELEAVKKRALGQTVSIDELFNTIDLLREEMRSKRLQLEKLVKVRKESIRDEIRLAGVKAYCEHIAALNERLGDFYLQPNLGDFPGVMKGKKTVTSLRDAVSTELARVKIASNELADQIDANLKTLRKSPDYAFLFHDMKVIALKANDDFKALVKNRIAEHKDKEEKRVAEERERIRQEELKRIEDERVEGEKRAQAQAKAAAQPAPAPKPARPDIVEQTQTAPGVVAVLHKPSFVGHELTKRGNQRPTDIRIIEAVAETFNVTEATAFEWIKEIDFADVGGRIAS